MNPVTHLYEVYMKTIFCIVFPGLGKKSQMWWFKLC